MQDDTHQIDELLGYWIGPPTADGSVPRDRVARWFDGDVATDHDIRARFGDARERAYLDALAG